MAKIKCPNCGKADLQPVVEPALEKTFEGVRILIKDAYISRCPVCGEETYSAKELRRWRAIKEEVLKSSGQIPTGADVKRVREEHGLSVADFASLVGVTRQTVYAWERDKDAGMKFGPASLLISLLEQESDGTVANVFAALLSFAKGRGQLTSLDDRPTDTDGTGSTGGCLSPPRPSGAPGFCRRAA